MLSRTAENYLRAIYDLVEERGYARVRDIASSLGVKPASACEMLGRLDRLGLVDYRKRGGISLTSEGRKAAALVNGRYKVFLRLFEIAGVPREVAFRDACALEHYVSDQTNRSLQGLVDRLERQKT